MRIDSFSVENYRSITKAKRISISDSTVLVGPNNEGKSNLVRGLAIAIQVFGGERFPILSSASLLSSSIKSRTGYSWERDFPMHLQEKKPNGKATFVLTFELSTEELADFKATVGTALDGQLSVKITFGQNAGQVTVLKQGRDWKSLSKRIRLISKFIVDRVTVEHIPAIRTAESAQSVVNSMLERELSVLENDPAYATALRTIGELQQPLLDKLSQSVQTTMIQFLPGIKDVRFKIQEERQFRALRRSTTVIVDDGTPTELKYKGDGVQSLAALALMRHASESSARGRTFVIVVEEPESHLHPQAMHSLKSVLNDLSKSQQLVLTTHSPLFVNRDNVSSNIIVRNAVARPAKDIAEIREVLGVKASDNLQLAELVLIVEGDEDKIALESILKFRSHKLASCFASRKLAIESLGGGSNLSYKAGLLRDALLCNCIAVLDNDGAGKAAAAKAISQGILTSGEITFATAVDLAGESEVEDLYDPKVYRDLIFHLYGVDVNTYFKYKNLNKKWSDRMGPAFKYAGKTGMSTKRPL